MSFQVGDTVGDYEVVSVLGAGGMGRVYKVRNVLSHRFEAMKVLLPELVGTADRGERFLREIRVLAALDHPNITALRTAQRIDDQVVMITELVEGNTLQAIIQRGPLYMKDAIDYMSQALLALAYAHDRGVIHRDIKPANIMLTPDGVTKLMDFGIAKAGADRSLTAVGTTLGSLYYMSPEQVKGVALDCRSDIYSLGITLYQAVTGSLPFDDATDYAVLSAHLNSPPEPPRMKNPLIAEDLEKAILKALAKDPANRFQTAPEFRAALQKITGLPGEGTSTRPIAVPEGATAAPSPSSASGTKPGSGKSSQLEMANVLFMDIVAYSQLPMDRQSERISQLVDIVRATDEFQRASQSDQIISLPTGDGMALVFFQNPIAPVACATEVARVLKTVPELKLRMGVHTGPVYRIADINTARNVAGGGINMAQRVMDCGDAGHILVSKTVADTLGQLSDYSGTLHDLGEAEVKHGVKVHIVNYVTSEVGNPNLPAKIQKARTAQAEALVPVASPPPASVAVLAPSPAPVIVPKSQPITINAQGSNRNGLMIAAGIVLVLIVAALAMSQFLHKGGESKQETNITAPPAQPPANSPSQPSAPVPPVPPGGTTASVPPIVPPSGITPPSQPPAAASLPKPAASATVAKKSAEIIQPAVTAVAQPKAPPQPAQAASVAPASSGQPAAGAADKAQLQEQQDRMMLLTGRVGAVNGSLNNLQRQQAASGLGLRGDMAAAKGSMDYLMGQAKTALAAGDTASAKRNLDMAEQQLEKLEKFLGL